MTERKHVEQTDALWMICRDIKGSAIQVLLDTGNTGPTWNSVRRVIGGKGCCVGVKIFAAIEDAEKIAKQLRTRVNGQKNISVKTLAELLAMVTEEGKRHHGT